VGEQALEVLLKVLPSASATLALAINAAKASPNDRFAIAQRYRELVIQLPAAGPVDVDAEFKEDDPVEIVRHLVHYVSAEVMFSKAG
jgi:hypothetical protein